MIDLTFIADALDGGGNVGSQDNLDRFDLDKDGDIDAYDCPFPGGSCEAKLWWRNVMEPSIGQDIPPEIQERYGNEVVGMYNGKPLIPGFIEPGQGDFQFLVDKIKVTQGLSHSSAVKVASKVKHLMFGG